MSLVKVLFERLELVFAKYATVPPGAQEPCPVSDELDEGGGNGVEPDAEATVPDGGVGAYQKRIKSDGQQTVRTEGRSQQEYGHSQGECGR